MSGFDGIVEPMTAALDGEPGTPFSDEVVVRRLRFTSEDSGFAVIDAERSGDDVVLVGTLAHLEERERVRIEGTSTGASACRSRCGSPSPWRRRARRR
jgi:hypothetical protein